MDSVDFGHKVALGVTLVVGVTVEFGSAGRDVKKYDLKPEPPLRSTLREVVKKSKWKFKMTFAIRGPTPPPPP